MNFFKKMLGFSADIKSQAEAIKIQGTLYRVIKDTRNIMFQSCTVTFEANEGDYSVRFIQPAGQNQEEKQYAFPIYTEMNLVSFSMNKGGKINACFEWNLDEAGEHIGCYMNPSDKDKFKDVICQILKILHNDQNIKDHLKLCKQLGGIPVYKVEEKKEGTSSVSSSGIRATKEMNEVLIREAGKDENRMVHSAIYYEIVDKERELANDSVVFVLKEVGKFQYEFQLYNATGFLFLKKQLTPSLIYEINTDLAYLKWLHLKQNYKVVQVNFEAKRDAAMSLKFAVVQCLYEINTKRRLQDAIAEDQIAYMRKISDKPAPVSNKIVKTYEDDREDIEMVEEANFIYSNKDAAKGLEKYRVLTQAKIHNFDVASLGNMLETLKISENNEIKQVDKKKIFDRNIESILLHDKDQKAILNDDSGILHYYDMEKGKIVQTYDVASKGIQDICPEFKLAQASDYKTFKAVAPSSIFQFDPRVEKGVVANKNYSTSPEFNKISVDCKGHYACGSANGEIRLYDKIGRNSNCKYPGFGDPVLHLESTKDGRWLLATFKNYIILLPTTTENDNNLYEEKIKICDRPSPIRLRIKVEHLQLCKIDSIQMIPAKFDERKGGKEMFIVSGFGEYVVVWNLANVIRGDVDSYKFMKIDGELVQTDFMFDTVKKLLMTTKNGIVVKENKVRT